MSVHLYEVRVIELTNTHSPYEWGVDFDCMDDALAWVSAVTGDPKCVAGLDGISFVVQQRVGAAS